MRTHGTTFLAVLVIFAVARPGPAVPERMVPIPRNRLCVTEGAITNKDALLAVNVPKMRAVVDAATAQSAEARLKYLGPTIADVPLASGEIRRQFALKLRAQDGCNLVYAVWRIQPKSEIVVSIKSNPSMHSSSECGNHGYRNIKPARSSRVPKLKPGDSHSLLADMNGSKMRVSIDGALVWEGDLGPESLTFDGPVGVRTDNGRFVFQFLTGDLGAPRPCREEDKDSD